MERSANENERSVVAPGARLTKLAGGFVFTEGPTCDAAGNVFFTDQPNDRIMKWSVVGGLSAFLHPAGRANGMCFDPSGHLIACVDEKNIDSIHVPDERWTANVSFGGNDRRTLFITTSTGLYAIRMRVNGANAAK